MAKFHINDRGEAGVCKANNGGCPFGSEAEHFSSAEEARQAFEEANSSFVKIDVPQKSPQEANGIYGTQANAIAHFATAHNSGNTVYEHISNADGSVSLKMSSWPRANEARLAFESKGYLAEFGANDMGQWLHVSVLPAADEIISSNQLDWDSGTKSFKIDRAQLKALPKAIYSPKLQETIALAPIQEGAEYAVCKPAFQEVDWEIRLY